MNWYLVVHRYPDLDKYYSIQDSLGGLVFYSIRIVSESILSLYWYPNLGSSWSPVLSRCNCLYVWGYSGLYLCVYREGLEYGNRLNQPPPLG